ncbi:hypothetical protein PAHAL_1G147900 [Panicum hallii]|uniref:Uncharacterized protein n=1 Tax=Panicum hallii TaxID=206008 RepID=A0A2S3GNR5_9POAL|nr:hypothetical protein PAHAL_1G147900 [Panicum hallii]
MLEKPPRLLKTSWGPAAPCGVMRWRRLRCLCASREGWRSAATVCALGAALRRRLLRAEQGWAGGERRANGSAELSASVRPSLNPKRRGVLRFPAKPPSLTKPRTIGSSRPSPPPCGTPPPPSPRRGRRTGSAVTWWTSAAA